jgi:CRP-like cAMP-binding protein
VIAEGTADVIVDGETVRQLGPGDLFGETAVMASGRRTATVISTSPMRLLTLFKSAVWELERRQPAIRDALSSLYPDP